MCDAPISSDDELMAHVLRHRAELEAAQHAVRRESDRVEAERKTVKAADEQRQRAHEARAAAQANHGSGHSQSTGRWGDQHGTQPQRPVSTEGRSRVKAFFSVAGLGLVGLMVVAILVAGSRTSGTHAGDNPGATADVSGVSVEEESARPAPTTTQVVVTTTTTAPTETLSEFDQEVRDFLILIEDLESNDRYLQASDGENWYRWNDEYPALAKEYLDLADHWDREYLARVEMAEPEFGQTVSHALIRRSDGYRLVYEASTPEAINEDIDSMLWGTGVEAIVEASTLFADVERYTPDQWQADVGIAGSAIEKIENAELTRPDPIPTSGLVVGDCYKNPPPGQAVSDVDRSSCSAGALEVYWVEDIGPLFEGWPGEDHVSGFVGELCLERAEDRFPFASIRDEEYWWWYTLADSWELGDSGVSCAYQL